MMMSNWVGWILLNFISFALSKVTFLRAENFKKKDFNVVSIPKKYMNILSCQ